MADTLARASRLDLAIRRGKVAALTGRRLWAWARHPARYPAPQLATDAGFPYLLHRSQTAILAGDPRADPRLEQGKYTNLALAAPCLDGAVVTPDRPLSFWRAVGRPSRARGFRHGREVRGGCIVPTIGGGLCLLSNALFVAGVRSGWTILERHGHTLDGGGGTGMWGLDATVAWPFVDLRMAPARAAARLAVSVGDGVLTVEIRSAQPMHAKVSVRETWRAQQGSIRENHIERQIASSTGVVARERIAQNRKRLVTSLTQHRSCLSCNQLSCHARPRDLHEVGS